MTLEDEIRDLDRRFGEYVRKSPKTSAEITEMESLRKALEQAIRKQEKPLTDDLESVGIRAEVWDLVNTPRSYPEAIPILIDHLQRAYSRDIKEGIVRALAVKEAKGLVNKIVMREYQKVPKDDDAFRWAFGNTMTVIATENDLGDLTEIVLDESNGDSRRSFIEALTKLKSPRVVEVLEHLVNDKSSLVSEAAEKALKKKQRHLKTK